MRGFVRGPSAMRMTWVVGAVLFATGAWGSASAPPLRMGHLPPMSGRVLVVTDDPSALALDRSGRASARSATVADRLRQLGLDRGEVLAVSASATRPMRVLALSSDRSDFAPAAAAAALRATGAFRAVCPDVRLSLFTTIPDDPYLPTNQWFIDDGGFADIGLPLAWDVEKGDTSIVIAILDTGVDVTHPDLAAQIARNPGEIPGNGLDDDGNGFADDTTGWDFAMHDANAKPERTIDPVSGIDIGFHGTMCAGMASARTNNGVGIAGAGWNCRILPVKISRPDSGLTLSAASAGIAYAAARGADVISMSFGAGTLEDPGVPDFFQALVDLATDAGALCVAAAGNDEDSTRSYPAACENVLSVGATTMTNERAFFSNFGPWVDVAAPGESIWSTLCHNYVFRSTDVFFYAFLWGFDGVNFYMGNDGTSFSAPLVAGVCALVRSRFPELTPSQVTAHVIATGDDVAYDQPIGPKVNAYAAVSTSPLAVPILPPPTSLALRAGPNPFAGATSLSFTVPAAGFVRVTVLDASGRRVRSLAEGDRPAGRHTLVWDGRDESGRDVRPGLYFARIDSGRRHATARLARLGP